VRVCVAVADEEGVCSRTWSKDLARESQRITADSTEPVRTQWLTGEGRGGEEKQVNKIIIIKTGPFLVSRENSSKKKLITSELQKTLGLGGTSLALCYRPRTQRCDSTLEKQ
jgi:hypothetical protein